MQCQNYPFIKTPNKKRYSLILDLNETLISLRYTNNSKGLIRVRPFLYQFLDTLSINYELILFTGSSEKYTNSIVEVLERNKKYFDFIFYREYAIIVGNDFVKDLTRVGRPLDSTIIVDNMPQNFRLQKENGIHIKPFYAQDPNDNTLIELMDILINIANSGIDVREGLANYRNDIVQKVTSDIAKYDN
jgi:Dullard-like phosphatase family protein